MPLPRSLRSRQEVWRGPRTIGAVVPICRVKNYQRVVQCQDHWCWAAVHQELLRRRDSPIRPPTQCQIVEFYKPELAPCGCAEPPNDCIPDYNHPCDRTGQLEANIKKAFPGRTRFDYFRRKPSKVRGESVCRWINEGRVVCAFFSGRGNHHYATIVALADDGSGVHQVEIADPELGTIDTVDWEPPGALYHQGRNATMFFIIE